MGVRGNLTGVAALACAVLLANNWISKRSVISADVAKQSDFLRTYNPVPLFNSFRVNCQSRTGVGTGSSAAAGYHFLNDFRNVQYTRTAHMDLCDQSQYPSVINALHRNVIAALHFTGCRVISDDFSPEDGVRIAYRCGTRSEGVVTSGSKRKPGDWPAYLSLQLDEEWYVRNPF